MAYTEYGGLPKATPQGPQTAMLGRGLTALGEGMMQKLYKSHKKDPNIEYFTYDDAGVFPGTYNESGPFLDMGTRQIHPDYIRMFEDLDQSINTAHSHPSGRPGSFSPADYYGMSLMSSGRNNPAGEHWVLKPETESWEGLRIKDPSLLINPEKFNAPSAVEALTGNLPSPLFDNVILGKSPIEERLSYAVEDLFDEEALELVGADPSIADDFYNFVDQGQIFADKFQPLLMKLAEDDRVDYYTPPNDELDKYFEAYKTLLENYE